MALGGLEWLLIALAFLLLFGGKRIPGLVRNIGQGIKEFRKTANEIETTDESTPKEVADSLPKSDSEEEQKEISKEKSQAPH